LGQYEGQNDDENQLLDAYTDLVLDWANKWATALFSGNEELSKKHETEYVPQALNTWNDILSDVTSGPFILGDRITYADFALYHVLEDASPVSIDAQVHPHIAAFTKAIDSRHNLSKYLASERK
ncbi:hypothetical protein ABG067_008931, partial [Albugo candida]